ncbi:MAG: ATP-binding protein [Sulfuricella sp.]
MQLAAHLDPLAEHLQALIEALPGACLFKDGAGQWRVANTAALRLMGVYGQAWEGKTDLELATISPLLTDFFTTCHRSDEHAWTTGKRFDSLEQLPGQDGFHIFSIAKIPLFNSDGTRRGLLVIAHDVTDDMKAGVTLAAANEMLISVLNGMEAIVYAADMHTHEIIFVNQYAERSLNKKIAVGGVCWMELACGQEGPCGVCNKHQFVDENDAPSDVHIWEYQNASNHRWYHAQDHAIRWVDGRLVRLQIATDITEQKKLEMLHQQRQMDIGHAARLSVAGEMASGLAHEIAQPLAAANTYLQGCVDLIESGRHDMEHLGEAIKAAHFQTERAGKIIAHLRDFICKGRNDRKLIDINQLAAGAIHFLDHEIKRYQIGVSFYFSELPPIRANPIEVEQVLINLMKNAIEAMQESSIRQLHIRTRLLEFAVEIEIGDRGKGIPESEIELIFNPFASSTDDGLGLGLTICRSIVESYGGQIRVSSSLDSGSIFTFTLPLEDHA